MRTKTFLICYDIHDKSRLRRVHKAVRDFGISVQYSVFKAELNPKKLDELIALLKSLIKPNVDNVNFYPLNPKETISLGVEPLSDTVLIL
jgi:CRISPR-associated protein Cas2